MNLIAALFASLCLCALVYQFSAIIALICFRRRPLPSCQSGVWPGISLLKPVRGLEQDSYDCLASFIRQDYPARQILFGVADPTDPILPLLRDLQATFGEVDIRVVICPQELGMNPKVSTLRQLLPLAVYDYILISDSDVRVRPDALRVLAGALQDPKAGLATCLYRPGPVDTNGAALEAMTISTDFIPSVAMAYYVEDIRFALGAVMALSQETLERIGGFEGIADHLADDYQLGLRVSEAGLQVQLLPYVVETNNRRETVMGYLAHQLRWARTYRVCRPKSYLAYGITLAFPWGVLAWSASAFAPWAGCLALGCLLVRFWAGLVAHYYCLASPLPWRYWLLFPIKEICAFALWVLSFLGNEISWRGQRYRVAPDGRLKKVKES